MRLSRIIMGLTAGLITLLFVAPAFTAPVPQAIGRQLPVPAAQGPIDQGGTTSVNASTVRADTHTLSSIEALGVGSVNTVRALFVPSFMFNQSGDTGIVPGKMNSSTSVGAGLAFDRDWNVYRLSISYNGAQTLIWPDSDLNSNYHNFSISQSFVWDRWVLRLRDDFSISPDADFGGLNSGALSVVGGNALLNGLHPSSVYGESILTQYAQRLRNTASAEINYLMSRRSTVTVAAYYALLNFEDPGYVNSRRVQGRVGYDYALSVKDVIGLMYDYGLTTFQGMPSDDLQTHTAQLAYGRKITGRMAFQASGGAQTLDDSQNQTLGWTASVGLTYETRRNNYSFNYAHVTSDGSGVFLGADSHTFGGSVRRRLTESWAGSVGAGYAFNKSLEPVNGVTDHYRNWYGFARLERDFGQHVSFNLHYGYQQQGAGSGTCPVQTCDSGQSRQLVGMTLQWHPWSAAAR